MIQKFHGITLHGFPVVVSFDQSIKKTVISPYVFHFLNSVQAISYTTRGSARFRIDCSEFQIEVTAVALVPCPPGTPQIIVGRDDMLREGIEVSDPESTVYFEEL